MFRGTVWYKVGWQYGCYGNLCFQMMSVLMFPYPPNLISALLDRQGKVRRRGVLSERCRDRQSGAAGPQQRAADAYPENEFARRTRGSCRSGAHSARTGQDQLAHQAFQFSPPAAPCLGGVRERDVPSVEGPLQQGWGPGSPFTVLLEIEALLTSKPLLCYLLRLKTLTQ